MAKEKKLSARERQILDILYRRGRGTVAEVRAEMSDPPSYDSVRTFLRILEEKKFVQHDNDGPRYVYRPVVPQKRAQRDALRHLVETFFDGSPERAAVALLELSDKALGDEELDALEKWVKQKGKEQ